MYGESLSPAPWPQTVDQRRTLCRLGDFSPEPGLGPRGSRWPPLAAGHNFYILWQWTEGDGCSPRGTEKERQVVLRGSEGACSRPGAATRGASWTQLLFPPIVSTRDPSVPVINSPFFALIVLSVFLLFAKTKQNTHTKIKQNDKKLNETINSLSPGDCF